MLADRATKPQKALHGTPCSIATLLETLPTKESDAFAAMLSNPRWSSEAIWLACRDEGYTLGRQSVGRHRREQCRCWNQG